MNTFKGLISLLLLLLSSCSSTPEQEKTEPTIINAKITVSAQVNPDIDNRTSPIVLRILELKNLGTYNESDFFGLFENYESVLGSELLGSEQLHLKPGETRALTLNADPETQYIAVIAAYRDINQAVWKDHIAVSAGDETQIIVMVAELAVSVWKK